MQRFLLVTEADARVLEIGSTIELPAGGQITPLARDTLRARRITVVGSVVDDQHGALVPAATVRRVVIGNDHSGLALKSDLTAFLRGTGLVVEDVGTNSTEPVDYPDTAAAVAHQVSRGEADAGIAIDGAGLGSAIAANKVAGVRAAMCNDRTLARYAREHNGANVLTLGASLITAAQAHEIVQTFLQTPMLEPRYIRRLQKIRHLELTR